MVWCPWASFANIIQDFKVVCLQRQYTYALYTIFFLIRRAVDYFVLISFENESELVSKSFLYKVTSDNIQTLVVLSDGLLRNLNLPSFLYINRSTRFLKYEKFE